MATEPENNARILIVGCGGIGGVLACSLLKNGADVSIATTNEEVRRVWAKTGPYLANKIAHPALPMKKILSSAEEASGVFDVVFVAVQPLQIEEVAQTVKDRLSESGRVVCLPNGLCESRLGKILGEEKVVGAVVAWGARMPEPGHYLRTSRGGFLMGALDGGESEELDRIEKLLTAVGPVERTSNLRGARFSKLSINCAVSALGTVGGETLGTLLSRTEPRRLGLALIREAVQVAQADGIELEKVGNIDVGRLVRRDPKRKVGKAAQHALLMAVGARYRKLRSSMLAAIERGRKPAVDFINGEICHLGRERGVPTPFNDAAQSVIWDIYHGKLSPGPEALAQMRERAELAGT